jgi:hypothetical protein
LPRKRRREHLSTPHRIKRRILRRSLPQRNTPNNWHGARNSGLRFLCFACIPRVSPSRADSNLLLQELGSKITAQSVIYCTIYCTKSPYCVRFHPKLCNPCRLKLLKPNGAAKVGRFSRPPVSTTHTSLGGSVINSLTAVRPSQNRWSFRPPVQSRGVLLA